MIQLFLSIFIGAVIGAITNELAIRMLFRPYHPWKIGNWQLPFTPGLIPKRRKEIAEQLGIMVEKYLFTAKGLKEFIENTGMKETLYQKLIEKFMIYKEQEKRIGDVFSELFQLDLRINLSEYSKEKVFQFLFSSSFKKKSVAEILPDDVLSRIEEQMDDLVRTFIQEIKEYLHSEQGAKWLESIILYLLEGKKMLGFLAGMLFDHTQIQHKLQAYLDELLDKPDFYQLFVTFLIKEWNQLKTKSIETWLDPMEPYLREQIEKWVDQGIIKIEEKPIGQVIEFLLEKDILRGSYNQLFEWIEERLEGWFSYLSIAKVVKEEVNRFSLRELEKMIVEVSARELKMITYFGGILGGLIGFFQGILFLFY
ncbi:DUF445 family protein [Tepidibacillus fermentans]|uniref:Uncharacterized membrane protein YheB (UPF0754 family) n=1 Tax=Tepidibacillus fermentans TaxID=1281767 RepID=A0A4R3KJP3_9BACI|nr:DUF445 family protein [Tepidibacillus fermentans]TCS83594.1 uncharacterized membrane protein YheB (UPF0754 family) [Tepidibacillus fermentans]